MNQTTQRVFRKTMELYTLDKRIHRYWKKLVAVSFGVAKEQGIEVQIVHFGDQITDQSKIYIYEDEELGIVYTDQFLKLAKNVMPSLYRRYQEGKQKYKKGTEELKSMLDA